MSPRPMLIVGYVNVLPHLDHFPVNGMILVEEPDVVRKRDLVGVMAGVERMRELIEWEYQLPASADEFFNTYPDLDPSVVVPLVEYAVPFAARLAERYGLPGAGSAVATVLRDKELLRRVTRAAGVPNPASVAVSGPEEVREFMAAHPGAVVLKPSNRQASLGTQVLHSPSEVDRAWAECVRVDEGVLVPDRPMPVQVLVERCMHGPEYSVEMLVRDGIPLFTNITAKSLFPGTRPVEQGHVVPADVPPELADALRSGTTAVLTAIGFGSGVIHCEWIVEDGVPHLVECAGRMPGDGIPDLIERAYPIDLATAYYAIMRGDEVPALPATAARATAVRFLACSGGRVESVSGAAEAEALPGVYRVHLREVGEEVPPLRSSWDRTGAIYVEAETPGAALKLADRAADLITITLR
ncbi:ATP-grasp domain-containing protein [Actinokineospora enzanensis]|uniref:ATP-grasp domain-containing protein n=1 Tax=Actinokineospora enzanensis TaxID=155975 RepID=UPI00039A4617|nr:ATP-grasp domain-containing protein [Actinokineospora enzanensis]